VALEVLLGVREVGEEAESEPQPMTPLAPMLIGAHRILTQGRRKGGGGLRGQHPP
jgi:hypothetical protein